MLRLRAPLSSQTSKHVAHSSVANRLLEVLATPTRVPRVGVALRWGKIAKIAAALACLFSFLIPRTSALADQAANVRPEVPVSATSLAPPVANNSPLLAVDPTEPRLVVLANRQDAPEFGCALNVSGDGGQSWVTAYPVGNLPDGADRCYAPQVAFGSDGTLYYLFIGLQGEGNEPMGAFLATSTDNARSFSAPHRVLGPLSFAVRMAIDPTAGEDDRLHLVWLQAQTDPPLGGFGSPPNPILAAFSEDGGETFSQPVQVSDAKREYVVAPALALGPDGAVHVLYYDLQDDIRDYRGLEGPPWPGAWSLVIANSSDGGGSFEPGVVVDDGLIPPGRVMLIFTMPPAGLAVADDGAMYAAWHDARNGDWDVFLARSTDRGRSWQDPIRVNDDAIGNGRHQYLPQVGIAPSGRVDAVFYDRRNDPENVRNDTYYTYSTSDNAEFVANLQLTRRSSHSQIGQRYLVPSAVGLYEFGSHPTLLSRSDDVLAAWTDTRNSGLGTNQQDIFAATVSVSEVAGAGKRTVPLFGLLGVVLIVAAGTVGALRRRRALRRAATPLPDG